MDLSHLMVWTNISNERFRNYIIIIILNQKKMIIERVQILNVLKHY